jgi:hypothetical protein
MCVARELVVGRHVDRRGVVQSVGGGGSAEWGGGRLKRVCAVGNIVLNED